MLRFPGSSFVQLKLKLKPKASKLITTLKWMHWAPATTRQFSSALLSFWAGYGDGARCSVFCAQCWVFPSQALHLPHSRITFALSCRALIIIKSNQPDSYVPAPTLAIHPWHFHKRHREALAAQPTASRQQMGARCNWYESEGRQAVGGLLIRTASQTKLAATPPSRPSYAAQPS